MCAHLLLKENKANVHIILVYIDISKINNKIKIYVNDTDFL